MENPDSLFLIIIVVLFFGFLVFALVISQVNQRAQLKAWGELASQTGLELHPGSGWFSRPYVSGRYQGHQVRLDTYVRRHGKNSTTYTRMVVETTNPLGVRLGLYRESVFTKIGRAFGVQDIEVYDSELDAYLSIKGEPQDLVRRLMMMTDVRQRLLAAKEIYIELEGKILHTRRTGIDRDPVRLKQTLDLLSALAEGVDRL